MELHTQARLIEFDPSCYEAGGLSTIVTRAEVAEAAAEGEFPARLVLDLDRVETEAPGETTARGRVTVDWDEAALEQLLQATDDEEITLWFDPLELALAFEEPDVEAHGLRERAAVLAVTVAATGMTAGAGLAGVAAAGTPVPAAGQAVIPDIPAGQQLQPRAAVHTGDATRIAPPGQAVIPDIPAGQQLQPRAAVHTGDATRIAPPGQAVIPDIPAGQQLQPRAAVHTGDATRIAPPGQAVIPDIPAGQQLQPAGTATSVSSGGTAPAFPSPGETAGIAAGVAMLIAAAGFGAARSRTRPPRPA